MLTDLQITRATRDLLLEAAAIQGRAFFDDPLFRFTFPDDAERRERLPWSMQLGIACGLLSGHVDTTAGVMRGHAAWLRPGATALTPQVLSDAGFAEAPDRMGEAALTRFEKFMDLTSEAHGRLIPGPHWYLMILGVDPPFQGQGVGSALIARTLALADGDRLPCYLDTTKERNLVFYRKHGFEVRHEADIVDGGDSVRVWMMIREPR